MTKAWNPCLQVEGCSDGACRKLMGKDGGSVVGMHIQELFVDAARIQVEKTGPSGAPPPCAFPITSGLGTTYSASLVKQQGHLLLDVREQPKQDGIITLGVPLWDALESMLAANDMPSLLQLAAYTFRRIVHCERCALYAARRHRTGMHVSPVVEAYMDSVEVCGDEDIFVLAESSEDSLADTTHVTDRVKSFLMRMQSEPPLPPFAEERMSDDIQGMQYAPSAKPVDLSRSTSLAPCAAARAAGRERGLAQLLMFPLCDVNGRCWGAIVGYNYERVGQWSLKDFNACESICNTLTTKLGMLNTLKDGARKIKLLNAQGDLLDLMQKFKGAEVLRGLVFNPPDVSLLSVVRHTQVSSTGLWSFNNFRRPRPIP